MSAAQLRRGVSVSSSALLLLCLTGCPRNYLVDRSMMQQVALAGQAGIPDRRIVIPALPADRRTPVTPTGEPAVRVLASHVVPQDTPAMAPGQVVVQSRSARSRHTAGIVMLAVGLLVGAVGAGVIGYDLSYKCQHTDSCYRGLFSLYATPLVLSGVSLTVTGIVMLGLSAAPMKAAPADRPDLLDLSLPAARLPTNASAAGIALRF